MFLEIATSLGALGGAALATHIPATTIAIIFGFVLLYSAADSFRQHESSAPAAVKPDALAAKLRMDSTYPGPNGPTKYHVQAVPAGFGIMIGAGALSG